MPKKVFMVYHIGRERSTLPLPKLLNKYKVTFLINPKEQTSWRQKGRKDLLNRSKQHQERRLKRSKQVQQEDERGATG
ncbi:hypothetical protein CathTA2_1031 [Caldalkalibacillus thermarum TA2.A1]|uniref:Uncharacterized protein n=1 Tax=Caldalkalibacillus thermarum (strain TA2.A1) TaxID=986075 RepID=F5L5G8_CALTT|nr:hypothetical protein [Caldalkalibacillus thermarum]EGL83402.1 hypothetical protein CathTA2_1031 [Caldalkalibacillus thermarum TA2.A1]QZT32679.1 hypothetical protein HUR95_09785 [Caldalkalibacillus thermarum TA2.A1]